MATRKLSLTPRTVQQLGPFFILSAMLQQIEMATMRTEETHQWCLWSVNQHCHHCLCLIKSAEKYLNLLLFQRASVMFGNTEFKKSYLLIVTLTLWELLRVISLIVEVFSLIIQNILYAQDIVDTYFLRTILNVTDVSVMNDDTLMISTKIKKIYFVHSNNFDLL